MPTVSSDAIRQHLESKKRYYFDFMGWSNVVPCPARDFLRRVQFTERGDMFDGLRAADVFEQIECRNVCW